MTMRARALLLRFLIVTVVGLPACREVTVEGSAPRATPKACGKLETLATGINQPVAMAYAAGNVYVAASDGSILSVPVSGGAPVVVSKSDDTPTPTGLTADATGVYALYSGGDIEKLPLKGEEPATFDSVGLSIASNANYLFVGGSDGSVSQISKQADPNTDESTLVSPPVDGAQVFDITVDDTNIYWIEATFSTSVLKKVPIVGGATTVLVTGTFPLKRVAAFGDYVYVSTYQDDGYKSGIGGIMRARSDSSEAPVEIASNESFPSGIAADATGVYWGGGDAGPLVAGLPVKSIPTGSKEPVVVAPASVTYTMKPCGGGICWLDAGAGNVMRYEECAP
jgi:hypothetical protein